MTAHLRKTGREDHDLVHLAHPAQERIYPGPFEHVEVVPVVLDLDGDDVVRSGDGLSHTHQNRDRWGERYGRRGDAPVDCYAPTSRPSRAPDTSSPRT